MRSGSAPLPWGDHRPRGPGCGPGERRPSGPLAVHAAARKPFGALQMPLAAGATRYPSRPASSTWKGSLTKRVCPGGPLTLDPVELSTPLGLFGVGRVLARQAARRDRRHRSVPSEHHFAAHISAGFTMTHQVEFPVDAGQRLRRGQVVNHPAVEQPPRFEPGVGSRPPRPHAASSRRRRGLKAAGISMPCRVVRADSHGPRRHRDCRGDLNQGIRTVWLGCGLAGRSSASGRPRCEPVPVRMHVWTRAVGRLPGGERLGWPWRKQDGPLGLWDGVSPMAVRTGNRRGRPHGLTA
jgi:hypothetical protein